MPDLNRQKYINVDEQRYAERVHQCQRHYHLLIDPLRELAREYGYALATHGSLARDIDLVAIPWVEDAVPAAILAEAIYDYLKAHLPKAAYLETFDKEPAAPDHRPHGRLCWRYLLCFEGAYIDMSVMPRQEDAHA